MIPSINIGHTVLVSPSLSSGFIIIFDDIFDKIFDEILCRRLIATRYYVVATRYYLVATRYYVVATPSILFLYDSFGLP